ncbi:MAG: GNAT family N-acetyltransferase [Pseudomonadota bacterium]
MTIQFRSATAADAPKMSALLNAIIAMGGTTAHRKPYDTDRMLRDYITTPYAVSCIVAEDAEQVLGFQSLEQANPAYPLPVDWGVIATFVKIGMQGRGVGGGLFKVTRAAAEAAGLVAIDATIRKENTGGLAYYGRLGFVAYASSDVTISKKYLLS